MGTADVFASLAKGDMVLYNDKKTPLTVTKTGEERVFVEGPLGGEYMLFRAEDEPDTILVAKPGNREYASYVADLRTVGRWQEVGEDAWRHSETGATISVEQNEVGYWTVTVDAFTGDAPDVPKYGFTEKELAVKEARRLIESHPEG